MENLQNYKNQIKEVESLVIKLENGELNLEGLAELELLTRKIHERSIILQYKAYEQNSIVEKGVMVEVAIEELEEFDIPNDAAEETVEEKPQNPRKRPAPSNRSYTKRAKLDLKRSEPPTKTPSPKRRKM